MLIDENRHLAMGHMLLENVAKLPIGQMAHIQQNIKDWGEILFDMVGEPDMLKVSVLYIRSCTKMYQRCESALAPTTD